MQRLLLRRGGSGSYSVLSWGGEVLTNSGDVGEQWKEHFEELLNLVDMPLTKEQLWKLLLDES